MSQVLPVTSSKDSICEAIISSQVTVLVGETGSGKTTQIAKFCLELGLGNNGLIAHTQPRRIAAKSVAKRISEETQTSLGTLVGYKVRFEEQISSDSKVIIMTDGILLAEAACDKKLSKYSVIIIDEAHERSLNIDLLLGLLKLLLRKREDLKVIITSATINHKIFTDYFANSKLIEVKGRSYPVNILYSPPEQGGDWLDKVISTIISLPAKGNILVFLAGESDIKEVKYLLEQKNLVDTEVLPLYARLSLSEQSRVFANNRKRKIILSTNIAETSITVPNVIYVIDSGRVRVSRYNHKTGIQQLPIESNSKASANQRAGRCGRVAPGTCYRIYSEQEFQAKPDFDEPEIMRSNLANLLLQMKSLNLIDIAKFPFLDMPPNKLISSAKKLLFSIKAINENDGLTRLGRKIATLPIDVKLAVMLVKANKLAAVNEILILTSFFAGREVRLYPNESIDNARQKHSVYKHKDSDFISILKLWERLQEVKSDLSSNKFKVFCQNNYLNYLAIREWLSIYKQLSVQIKAYGITINNKPATEDYIHQALLVALHMNVIKYHPENKIYNSVYGKSVNIVNSSNLKKTKAPWVMCYQFIETTKIYANYTAKIDSKWLVQAASHLIKYNYSEPFWDPDSQQVIVYESANYNSFVIYAKKRKLFKNINPSECRKIFIEALILGEVEGEYEFIKYNNDIIESIKQDEIRTKQEGGLLDINQLYVHYSTIIPDNVFDTIGFKAWLKKQPIDTLNCSRKKLMKKSIDDSLDFLYPKFIVFDKVSFELMYDFDSSRNIENVSIFIPAGFMYHISQERLDWLVPGFIEQKIIAILKSLPKDIRTQINPIKTYATTLVNRMPFGEGNLYNNISLHLYTMCGVRIAPSLLKENSNGLINIRPIIIQDSKSYCYDSLEDAKKHHSQKLALKSSESSELLENKTLSSKDISKHASILNNKYKNFPENIEFLSQNTTEDSSYYLALKIESDSVIVAKFLSEQDALISHEKAILYLLELEFKQQVKMFSNQLDKIIKPALLVLNQYNNHNFKKQLIDKLLKDTFLIDNPKLADRRQFLALLENNHLSTNIAAYLKLSNLIIDGLLKVSKQVLNLPEKIKVDIENQLQMLFVSNFLYSTDINILQRYPIFLHAILLRIEKAKINPNKDISFIAKVAPWQLWVKQELRESLKFNSTLNKLRWMLEEYRISLFAQKIKTLYPISTKKLNLVRQQYLATK